MRKNNLIIFAVVFLAVAFMSFGGSTYTRSVPSYSQFSYVGGLGSFAQNSLELDSSMCQQGQDFILQIVPGSCEPAVVRSDLLEEQDVPVFCKIAATQINPLIDVKAINTLTLSGRYSEAVRTVGYFPSQSALGLPTGELTNPLLSDLGYALIVLKKQPNESAIENCEKTALGEVCWAEGNLTAKISYDIQNAFGIGNAEFYLPVADDAKWENTYTQYSFWNGRGYLRADSVDDGGARISIYSDASVLTDIDSYGNKDYSKMKYYSVYLNDGETSNNIYLSGFSPCMGSLSLRLNGLEDPDTRVKLKINSDYVEVGEGEKFLEGRCSVADIDSRGLYQAVDLRCKDDEEKTQQIKLSISPRVKLNVNSKEGEYKAGDLLYRTSDGEESVYLGFVGSSDETSNIESLYAVLVSLPIQNLNLGDSELKSIATHMKYAMPNSKTGSAFFDAFSDTLNKGASMTIAGLKSAVKGENFKVVPYKDIVVSPTMDFKEGKVSLLGFAGSEDQSILYITEDEYVLSRNVLDGGSVEYLIQKNGKDTGLSVVYGTGLNYATVDLVKKGILTTSLGRYNGKGCISEEDCNVYTLTLDKIPSGYEEMFENYVGSEIIKNENKLTIRKAVYGGEDDTSGLSEYYKNAMSDFQTVISSYSDEKEKESSTETFGEKALFDAINLANNLGKKKTMLELCDDFGDKYPNSIYNIDLYDICNDDYLISSSGILSREIVINGNTKKISFYGVNEPSYTDYGAEVLVRGPNGNSEFYQLEKNKIVYLTGLRDVSSGTGTSDYIMLKELDDDSAVVEINIEGESTLQKTFLTDTKTIELDNPLGLQNYVFNLNKVNLNKLAKVSVIANINYAHSNSSFPFKVGIEKRAFTLSPEKANETIDSLNNSIDDLEKISNNLGVVVNTMQKACIATGTVLTVKNFINNVDGKSIARQEVMQGSGGWNEFCAKQVNDNKYISIDKCLLEHNDDIERDVNEYSKIISSQNSVIKNLESSSMQERSGQGIFSGKYVDTDEFVSKYKVVAGNSLNNLPTGIKEDLSLEGFDSVLDNGWENSYYDIEQLKEIDFYSQVLKNNPNDERALTRLTSVINQVKTNSEKYAERDTWANLLKVSSDKILWVDTGAKTDKQSYTGLTYKDVKSQVSISGVNDNTPVSLVSTIQGEYYAVLRTTSGSELPINIIKDKDAQGNEKSYFMIYDKNGNLVKDSSIQALFSKIYFSKVDSSTYENKYINPEIKYYETDPYKGYPAVIPIDTKNGWYAATKPTISGTATAYDTSGRLGSFWLCNVGPNGIQEFYSDTSDDQKFLINLNQKEYYKVISGMSDSQASALVDKAVKAVEEAQRAYKNGVKKVNIGGTTYNVGSPAVNTQSFQCQDFMSPKDCNLLFNVCDPVICPSSRCDMGGTYPVQDVVQSGIIGSIALCLPNARENIYVPVCLTGVKSGIDGFVSVQKAYRDCLQQNLETGETVGICDEIYSMYMCDFFWKQALPVVKLGVPKLLEVVLGQNSARGGGEYLGVQEAWSTAKTSMDYFVQYYAEDSYRAFKIKSTENIGGEVCKSFISSVAPSDIQILSGLTESRSPPQFYGNFDEIPFTTTTNPPISHYKVYYHIYAGTDTGAYYQVYLRGSGGSYYQDTTLNRIVASGYASVGGYATDTVDFTAPSGYEELCVSVNGQEECGFKQVSTSFALNYLNDLYLENLANQTQIKTESECISGTASLYSLINPNLQEGASDLLNPELNKGIIRVCGTSNPGLGVDGNAETKNSRWVEVGYCDTKNVKCWLDTDSVKDVIKSTDIENQVLEDVSQNYLNALFSSGNYMTSEQYESNLSKLYTTNMSNAEKIKLLTGMISSLFWNNQKAQVYLLRGEIYSESAVSTYEEIKKLFEEQKAVGLISGVGGEVCEIVEVPSDIDKMNDARQRVLAAAQKLDGTSALKGSVIQDYDKSGGINCFDSTLHVYRVAGVTFSCVYSDKLGKEYNLGGKTIKTDNKIFLVNEAKCSLVGLNENDKLKNVQPGDLLSIVYNSGSGHNVIFINWINDGDYTNARIFDWINTDSKGNKIFGYRTIDLSDGKYSVYMFWKPVLSGSSTTSGSSATGTTSKYSDPSSEYISPTFIFQDGSTSNNVEYKYFDKKWYWSYSGESWPDWTWTSVDVYTNTDGKTLNSKDQAFMKLLLGENFPDGLKLLVDRIVAKDEGGWFSPDLLMENNNIEITTEMVFTVKPSGGSKIYFSYDSEKKLWRWGYGGVADLYNIAWVEVPSTEKYPGIYASRTMTTTEKEMILSLDKKDFVDGMIALVQKLDDENKAEFNRAKTEASQKLGNSKTIINPAINTSKFKDSDLEIIRLATSCTDCEKSSSTCYMGDSFCKAIGIQIGEDCRYFPYGSVPCLSYGKVETPEIPLSEESQAKIDERLADTAKYEQYEKIVYPYTSKNNVQLAKFSVAERKTIISAEVCNDCGDRLTNLCDVEECKAVSLYIGRDCVYEDVTIGKGKCSEIPAETTLIDAANEGDLDKVKSLIEAGVDIEAKDYMGKTPLIWASHKDNSDVVEYLIEKGANIEATDNYGFTPLSWAVDSATLVTVKILVEKGANIDVKRSDDGETLLMIAAYLGRTDIAKYLVEQGVNINVKDNEGKTALDIAEEEGYNEIVSYLKSKGAVSGSN